MHCRKHHIPYVLCLPNRVCAYRCACSYVASVNKTGCERCGVNQFRPFSGPQDAYGGCQTCDEGMFSYIVSGPDDHAALGFVPQPADSGACSRCPAGHYRNSSMTLCTRCPAGTYSSANMTSSSCTPCRAGFFANAQGSTSCAICPYGSYCPGVNEGNVNSTLFLVF